MKRDRKVRLDEVECECGYRADVQNDPDGRSKMRDTARMHRRSCGRKLRLHSTITSVFDEVEKETPT